MFMNGPLVSIILPCYNEEEHLIKSISILIEQSKSFEFPHEFIFVEDKSKDNTAAILQQLEPTFTKARFIYHETNKGRGAAVKTGFQNAKGDIVGFIDIDLEVSPRYINDFIGALKDNDVAIASRRYFSDTYFRALVRNSFSHYYRFINKTILKHPYTDTEAGFKFFQREKVKEFFEQPSNDHWFWDTEFMMYCFNKGLKVTEIPVEFLRDHSKRSTVNVVTDSMHYISQLIKYKKQNKK
jgi:dolichyl-phosphate beta-glucosyltransferase